MLDIKKQYLNIFAKFYIQTSFDRQKNDLWNCLNQVS